MKIYEDKDATSERSESCFLLACAMESWKLFEVQKMTPGGTDTGKGVTPY